MKKVLLVLLLLAELLLDLAVLSLLRNNSCYIGIVCTVIIWGAMLLSLVPKLKKADDAASRRKLCRRLIAAMAVPVVICIILVIGFVIGLSTVI